MLKSLDAEKISKQNEVQWTGKISWSQAKHAKLYYELL